MPTAQRDLINRLFDSDEAAWLVVCDGGRHDVFTDIYDSYLDGDLQQVWNGDATYTATWFSEMFTETYDRACFHGGLPIHAFDQNPAGYDEREHFATVAGWETYPWDHRRKTCPPDAVVSVVEDHLDECRGGVIRLLQPHNPYREHPEVNTNRDARRLGCDALTAAYRDNYAWALDVIQRDLLPLLDGDVVVTADHGQCLGDCGQWLHGPDHDPHSHLVDVPWLAVS